MKVLIIGDVMGSPGRTAMQNYLKKRKKDYDFIIVNGENAAAGFGITPKIADEFFELGVDVITSGNHIWDKKELYSYLNENKNFVVSNVYINSTADKKGLKPQDEIISLDDLKCSENDSDTIIKYIKAHEGQNVKTKYLRDGKEYTTNLIPGIFDSTVVCNVYEDYGEIILTSFSENSGKDFSKAMSRLQEAGIKKLVLDLR